jgi:predicted nucleotidyltransferase
MGTTGGEVNAASALFGKARKAILAILFGQPDQEFYLRQIVRTAGVGQGAIQRELARLTQAELVIRTRRGNQVFYQANRQSPVFAELRGLTVKTVGVADVLRAALAEVADRVRLAFVYGSVAKGSQRTASDVDVMIVGDLDFGEAVEHLHSAERELGREINPSVFRVDEFSSRAAANDHFLRSVLREPKVFLIGGEDELRGLAEPRLVDKARDQQPGDRSTSGGG